MVCLGSQSKSRPGRYGGTVPLDKGSHCCRISATLPPCSASTTLLRALSSGRGRGEGDVRREIPPECMGASQSFNVSRYLSVSRCTFTQKARHLLGLARKKEIQSRRLFMKCFDVSKCFSLQNTKQNNVQNQDVRDDLELKKASGGQK